MTRPTPFLSVDWGTTALRVRWVGGPGRREVRTGDGASRLSAAGGNRAAAYAAALRRARHLLEAPADLPVVISGMAGSSIGWREIPYARLPFALDGRDARWERIDDGILLLSGLEGPGDMMRGEETQALGAAALLGDGLPDPATLILPGTHSKHLALEDGRITAFRTHLTGELYDLLVHHSVLRHSVDPSARGEPGKAFDAGVAAGAGTPLSAALFRVRTRQVLDGHPPADNAAYLSGLLIGAELATLPADETPVIIAADDALDAAYVRAAHALGLGRRLHRLPAAPLAELGQRQVLRRIRERET